MNLGDKYIFRVYATNPRGNSDYSDTIRIGLGPLPSTPAAPSRASEGNTDTSIGVEWTELTGQTLPVSYYILRMDEGNGVQFSQVYTGTETSTVIEDLTPGVTYTFTVSAVNFNGEGAESTEAEITACVAPSGVSAPSVLSLTATTVTLRWEEPENNGGCSITSYAVFRDDGAGSAINVNMESASVANKPYLFEYTFTLGSTYEGLEMRF